MEEQYVRQETTQGPSLPFRRRGRGKKRWVVGGAVLLALLGVTLFFRSRSSQETLVIEPTPEPAATQETPSPTPTPEPLDRNAISIEIQNGTGIPKQAAYLQDKLKELGYTQIEVRNAQEQNHETTKASFAPSIPDQVKTEISETLNQLYQEVEVVSHQADADIQIIAGLRQGQSLPTPTPTIEPTPTATGSASPTPSL